jgi:hypothetical protein
MLIGANPAVFDTLHSGRCRRSPLCRLRLRLCLSLRCLLLRFEWRQHIVGRRWCSSMLLRHDASHGSIYVRVGRVCTAERIPHCSQLITHELILFLCSSTVFSFWPQPGIFSTSGIVCSSEILNILNSCKRLDLCESMENARLTFCKDLPLAGFASWRVGQDVVQFIEKAFHFASALPLRHLVAYTELWCSTVVSTACSHSCMISVTLQACDTAMLHRMVMRGCNICESLTLQGAVIGMGRHTIIQSLLSMRKFGVRGEDTTVDRCGKAILSRRKVRAIHARFTAA